MIVFWHTRRPGRGLVKASSLRWGLIMSLGGFALAMVGLTIYRFLQAAGDDPVKALAFFGSLIAVLCVVGMIVARQYRQLARTTQGLLGVLEGRYPGQAFAVFKTIGLQSDIDTLPVSLKGDAWNKRTLYAVLTLDSESMTFWDGSATKPVMTARLDRSELRSIDPADDAAFVFNARALTVALLHDAVTLRVTVAPAQAGDWIFFPSPDSFTLLETALTTSMTTSPTTQTSS